MKLLQRACVLFTLWAVVTFGLSMFVHAPVVQASINSGFVSGAGNLTTTGAIPFQNGTAGQVTQASTFTYASGVLQTAALGSFKFATSCKFVDGTDGFMILENNAGTGTCQLMFGPGGGSTSTPVIVPNRQVNPQLFLRDASGAGTANLMIEAQKSTTGQRYVCITTAGQLISSASACSGT